MRSFMVDGCDVRYRSRGTGVPVLFTHGAGADHVMFDAQADFLVHLGYRVVTWDLRGHGRSRPAGQAFTAARALADMRALLDHLELDKPVLVGQSLGGNLSQALVRSEPGRARALVVIDSTWNTQPLSGLQRGLLGLAAPAMNLIPAKRMPGVLARGSATTPAARMDAERAFSQLTKREFIEVWRATTKLLDPDPGYRTPVPLCLIRGAEDGTGNIRTAMPVWAAAEGVAEHVIAGAGHIANQDAPDAVNAVIGAFVAEVG